MLGADGDNPRIAMPDNLSYGVATVRLSRIEYEGVLSITLPAIGVNRPAKMTNGAIRVLSPIR